MSDVLLCAPVHRPPCRSSRSAVSSPKPFLLQSGPSHLPQPLFTQLCPSEHLPPPNHSDLSCAGDAQNCLWCFQWLLKSADCQEAMVSLDQGGCAPAGAAQCHHHVLHVLCAGMYLYTVLTTDVSAPPAAQLCREPRSFAHICV